MEECPLRVGMGQYKSVAMYSPMSELVTAYSATAISISGRFIFMYLLYTKQSTNPYSLLFSIINMISSSLWISYGQMKSDMPLLVRGSSDLLLFTISAIYIARNRVELNKIEPNIAPNNT
jgi:lipid-A-disaccharide synthase-like uncharacterized protein